MIAGRALAPAFAGLVICAALAGGRQFATGAIQTEDPRVVRQWEVPLAKGEWPTSVTVCGDGTVYLLSTAGNVRMVRSNGKVQQISPGIGRLKVLVAASCDEHERLYVAGHDLRVFEPDGQGRLNQLSTIPLKTEVSDLVVAPDGSIYGLGLDGLVAISSEGKLKQLIRWPTRGVVSLATATLGVLSTMIWDESHRRLIYGAADSPEIRTMDPEKGPTNDVKAFSMGRTGRIARLPNGNFAVTEIEMSEIADVYNRAYLRILDSSFQVTASVALDGLAALAGSGDDGSLYLVEMGKLVKVMLRAGAEQE